MSTPDTVVHLLRHGEVHNPQGILYGRRDGFHLSELGQKMAQRVADVAGERDITHMVSSPLERAQETAAPLAERLGLQPEAVADLREVHLGEWEGGEMRIRAADRDPMFFRVMAEERWDTIPGAEPADGFTERVRRGMEHVVATAGAGVTVAAVVHGGVIGELCRQATRSRPFAFIHADNCSLSRIVVFGSGHWLLRSFNDTAHLA
jgi:probable phosphoglycerate mutase